MADMQRVLLPDLRRVCCSPSFLDIFDFQLSQVMNRSRAEGEGNVAPFEVIPFNNGNDPTQPPVSYRFGLLS